MNKLTNEELERKAKKLNNKSLDLYYKNFMSLYNQCPLPTLVLCIDGKIIGYNLAMEELIGYKIEEIGEIPDLSKFIELLFLDNSQDVFDIINKSKNKEIENNNLVLKMTIKDGKQLFVEFIIYSIISAGIWTGLQVIHAIDITERINAEEALELSKKKLKEQRNILEQKNIALREIIEQVEFEKKRIQENVIKNINDIVFPILEKIKNQISNDYIILIEQILDNITSSFGLNITKAKLKLTQREIEICTLIRNGNSNKEISKNLNISIHTVEKHRNNIRKKLDILNKDINLVTYIQNL
ncbi:MAG: PAS domain S-box protein [Candidatus Latescibacteria bacterium]|nr:PAS domain S-box protein [Candidatus Latescibacterota bacterium]